MSTRLDAEGLPGPGEDGDQNDRASESWADGERIDADDWMDADGAASDQGLDAAPEPGTPDPAAHDDTGLDLATMVAHATRGRRPAPRPRQRRPQSTEASTWSTARADGRDPQPLGRALGRLSRERGWDATVSVHLLLARWPALVGPVVAAHSTPESFDGGTLVVRTDSTAWATQLRLMAPNVLAALNAEVGEGAVTLLRVLGPDAPSWKHGVRSVSDGRGPRDTYG